VAVLTSCDRQRNCSVAAAAMNGSGPPICMLRTTPMCSTHVHVGGPRHLWLRRACLGTFWRLQRGGLVTDHGQTAWQ